MAIMTGTCASHTEARAVAEQPIWWRRYCKRRVGRSLVESCAHRSEAEGARGATVGRTAGEAELAVDDPRILVVADAMTVEIVPSRVLAAHGDGHG